MGFGLIIGCIEHLQIVTITNHSAIANSHTLQFTTARTKLSQSATVFTGCLITASNAVALTASVFTFILVGDYLATNLALLRNGLQQWGSSASHASTKGDCLRRPPMGLSPKF
jgi:hypothetical protein